MVESVTDETDRRTGWVHGAVGMLIFSGSLPATRAAVLAFDPLFLTFARATIAGAIALAVLKIARRRWPGRAMLGSLVIVALGVVVAFPLFTALALRTVPAAHSLVFLGLLPLSTAIWAVVRGGERPGGTFWLFSAAGAAMVMAYAWGQGAGQLSGADFYLLAAIILCGLGYAEGGKLAREMGGWQVICFALVLALPVMLVLTLACWPVSLVGIGAPAWLGLGYVSVFSMLIAFVFWYRGLALGGIAAVGQLQLLQPFFGLALAALLLGEAVDPSMLASMLGVLACVALSRRFAGRRRPNQTNPEGPSRI